jgi:hypothetical protein
VTDFLDEKRREIAKRLQELKPLAEEYSRLDAAASALDGVSGSTATIAIMPRRKGPGRPPGPGRKKAATTAVATPGRKPGRPPGRPTGRRVVRRKGSGTRAAQALSFVQGQPGITIPELAAKMGIQQNYLYRVLPSLEQDGKVAKQGRGWHAKGS